MAEINKNIFDSYFNTSRVTVGQTLDQITKPIVPTEDNYTYNQFVRDIIDKPYTSEDIPDMQPDRYIAENNIDDIDQLGELIRKILNAAWGGDWGDISPDLKRGENAENIPLPQITFDINSREVAENTPVKPKLTDTIIEIVNGEKTGDSFNIYRQWFDCIVEFNFWGRNTLEARQLMNKFETLIGAYSGYIKKQGVAEILFLKEVTPKQSVKYVEGIPMRSLMYYVRLERIQSVRLSTLEKIDIKVSATNVKIPTTGHSNSSDDIFKNNNITYKL